MSRYLNFFDLTEQLSWIELQILANIQNRGEVNKSLIVNSNEQKKTSVHIRGSYIDEAIGQLKEKKYISESTGAKYEITKRGVDILVHIDKAEKQNTEDCIKNLKILLESSSKIANTLDMSRRIFTEIDKIMMHSSSSELINLLLENIESQDDFHIGLLVKALKSKSGEIDSKAIQSRFLNHLIGALTAEEYNENSHLQLEIVLDTNIIIEILSSSSDKTVFKTLKKLFEREPKPKFIILESTLRELYNVMISDDNKRRAIVNLAMDDSRSNYKKTQQTYEAMSRLGQQYLQEVNKWTSFSHYSDFNCKRLLGLAPLDTENKIFWEPIVDSLLDSDEIQERFKTLRNSQDWKAISKRGVRAAESDFHDVILVSYVAEAGENINRVIWTHHMSLHSLAAIIELSDISIAIGPAVGKYTSKIEPSELREYCSRLFFDTVPQNYSAQILEDIKKNPQQLKNTLAQHTALFATLFSGPYDPITQESAKSFLSTQIPTSVVQNNAGVVKWKDHKWIDLTIDWGQSLGGHGVAPLQAFRGGAHAERHNALMLQFSPHTMTHTDLPWAIKDLPVISTPASMRWRDKKSAEAKEYVSQLSTASVIPAVFINLTEHLNHPLLFNHDGRRVQNLEYLGPNKLVELLLKLRVRKDSLEEKLKQVEIENKLLVLHTGWTDIYANKAENLSSLFWECRHPWLLHPWLDRDSVSYLISRNIYGIAIDAPMADCPLYIAKYASPQQSFSAKVVEIFNEIDSYEINGPQPAHIKILGNFKLLIESLKIPKEIIDWYSKSSTALATLFTSGISFTGMEDALLLQVYAKHLKKSEIDNA